MVYTTERTRDGRKFQNDWKLRFIRLGGTMKLVHSNSLWCVASKARYLKSIDKRGLMLKDDAKYSAPPPPISLEGPFVLSDRR